MPEPEVKQERTGWRDAWLSARHRLWGFDVPMVDVDWLVIEYDNSEPIALIDYKEHSSPRVQGPTDANSRAIAKLATRAGIPAYNVRYWKQLSILEFFPIALNDSGESLLPSKLRMNEIEFVTWIYKLRGRSLPESVLNRISVAAY